MITFATEFPANAQSVGAVLDLGRTWILGSPHTKFKAEDLQAQLLVGEHFTKQVGSERVEVAHAQSSEYELGGVRYSRVENGALEWVTTVVAARQGGEVLISLQTSCEALNTVARLPKANKPYVIKQVLESIGGGMDGEIPVADRPFYLSSTEVDIAAELLNGKGGNRLPLVYISSRYDGSHAVDPKELARWVAGLAHVVVEPSRAFSALLKNRVDGRNVYAGAIGVYWPASYSRKMYYRPDQKAGRHLQVQIARDIQFALANRRQTSHCTWLHLNEVLAAQRLERIKRSGSVEVNEFIEAFDAELKAKEERLLEAQAEIVRLNGELSRTSAVSNGTGGLLKYGAEQDFYPGEIQDIAIGALEHYSALVLDGSRKQHIVQDLLASNKKTQASDRIDEEVKSIFRTYTDMDSRSKARLQKLGFDLSEDGKHFKAVYQGDPRYTFAISKTGSDHRGGKNLASDILKKIL